MQGCPSSRPMSLLRRIDWYAEHARTVLPQARHAPEAGARGEGGVRAHVLRLSRGAEPLPHGFPRHRFRSSTARLLAQHPSQLSLISDEKQRAHAAPALLTTPTVSPPQGWGGAVFPTVDGVPPRILRRVAAPDPSKQIGLVPFVTTIHDRLTIEIRRGCTRGCRRARSIIIFYLGLRLRCLRLNVLEGSCFSPLGCEAERGPMPWALCAGSASRECSRARRATWSRRPWSKPSRRGSQPPPQKTTTEAPAQRKRLCLSPLFALTEKRALL